MREWVVCSMLAVVAVAGCAEPAEAPQDTADADTGADDALDANATALLLPGTFGAAAEGTNLTAGIPFNVTLSYTSDNGTDPSALTWQVSVLPADSPTDANGTGDGNATAGASGPGADNATAGTQAVASYNGTGLPATIAMNLTEGNFTLVGNVTDGNATASLNQTLLTILGAVSLDPCANAPVQEPITISDIFVAVAVDGTGLYQGHAFDLEPCQTTVFAEITSGEAYLDPMLRLKDNNGDEVDAEDNEFLYHDTLTYEPGGYLEPGTWQIDARGYVGAPGTYEIVLSFEAPE